MSKLLYNFPGEEYEDKVFFASDHHFRHRNILKYCNRPFSSIEEMNETLIENWNRKVGKDDIVFHLGDFCFGGEKHWTSIRSRLNGEIILIVGNHDLSSLKPATLDAFTRPWLDRGRLFVDVCMQTSVKVNGQLMILAHEPLLTYSGMYENRVINAFGHVHLRTGYKLDYESQLEHLRPCQYDVGVDMNNYTPISYRELKEKIDEQIKQNKNCLMWI